MSRVYRNEKPVVDVTRWFSEPNGSVFIKYVPNHLSKTDLRNMFEFLGTISRIDVVNITEGGSGRRAFIHFSNWIQSPDSVNLRTKIAQNYPLHTQFNFNGFEYSITLNSRPIPPAELNPQQLSDWSQRLNDELVDFKRETAAQIAALLAANAKLTSMVETVTTETEVLRTEISHVRLENDELRFEVRCLSDRIEYMEQEQEQEDEPFESAFEVEDKEAMNELYDTEEMEIDEEQQAEIDEEQQAEIDEAIDMQEVLPGISVADIEAMEEFEMEIERDADRTHGPHQYMVDDIQLFDLDAAEAGIRRRRDPLIFERQLSAY